MPLHISEYNYSVHTYSYKLSGASLITIHYTISDEAGNWVVRWCHLCPHSLQIKVCYYSLKYVFITARYTKEGRCLLSSSFIYVLHYISVSSYSSKKDLWQKFCFALQIQTMYFQAAMIFRNALLSLLKHRQNL